MLDLCTRCGESQAEPEGERASLLVCRSCGERRAFRRLPLLLVGGPAGAGKSTVGAALLGGVCEAVVMDSDMLWRREFDTPGDGYREYFRLWLRLCANVAQAGRPSHSSAPASPSRTTSTPSPSAPTSPRSTSSRSSVATTC